MSAPAASPPAAARLPDPLVRPHPPARLAWIAVAINLAVILWGAVVRATGSGAGCGSHWPLCNGEVVPRSPQAATWIEFGHRLTSGIALAAVLWVAARVLRAARSPSPRDRGLRRLAWLSLLFIVGEAAIGAGIVLFEYVGENASPARAAWMGFHLTNTFLLLGALALLADRLGRAAPPRSAPAPPAFRASEIVGLALLLLTGASGAIAALGDTLFPASSLAHGLAQDLSPTSSFLLRLRGVHPLIAIAAGLLWLHLAQESRRRDASSGSRSVAGAVTLLVFAQLAVGLVNLGLLAPVALQLAHLLLADLLWIAAVLLVDRRRSPS
jgi:heme A synthase